MLGTHLRIGIGVLSEPEKFAPESVPSVAGMVLKIGQKWVFDGYGQNGDGCAYGSGTIIPIPEPVPYPTCVKIFFEQIEICKVIGLNYLIFLKKDPNVNPKFAPSSDHSYVSAIPLQTHLSDSL